MWCQGGFELSICAGRLHTMYRICSSAYKPFCTSVFESVSACLCCLCVSVCVCLARQWFLSAPRTRDSILPKGPTVGLVTAAIFAPSSSSCTSFSSSSLNLPHALSTSNVQDEGNFPSQHTLSPHTYIPFSSTSCLLMPFQPSFHSAENSLKFKFALLAP